MQEGLFWATLFTMFALYLLLSGVYGEPRSKRPHAVMYAECGFGNESFLSTEIERVDGEVRVRGFFVDKYRSMYWRLWIGKIVIVSDSVDGSFVQFKRYNSFKFLVGISSK